MIIIKSVHTKLAKSLRQSYFVHDLGPGQGQRWSLGPTKHGDIGPQRPHLHPKRLWIKSSILMATEFPRCNWKDTMGQRSPGGWPGGGSEEMVTQVFASPSPQLPSCLCAREVCVQTWRCVSSVLNYRQLQGKMSSEQCLVCSRGRAEEMPLAHSRSSVSSSGQWRSAEHGILLPVCLRHGFTT